MTDWTPEEDEAFNEVEKHSNLGKQILRGVEGQPYVYTPKREWVGLTKEERHEISMANRPYCADVMAAHEEELKRRNT
jgi:hypothetical protein